MNEKIFKILFKIIPALILIIWIMVIVSIIGIGVGVVNEVNENNGSIGKTIGVFIKEIKEGAEQ